MRHQELLGSVHGQSLSLRVVHRLPAPHRQSAAAMFLDPGREACLQWKPGRPQGDWSVGRDAGVREPQIHRETKLFSNAHQALGWSSPKFPHN